MNFPLENATIFSPGHVEPERRRQTRDGGLNPACQGPVQVVRVEQGPQGQGVQVDGLDEVRQQGTLNAQDVPAGEFV